MSSKAMSPNHREAISAVSSITGRDEYILSTNGAININGTIGGSALPISGATTGVGVAILDGSGNQITSFGGGTQYADGAARGTATGTLAMVDDGANIQSILGDSSGRIFTNISQINAVTPLMGNGTTGTGSLRVTIASDNSAVSGLGVAATGSTVPASASYQGLLAQTALPTAASAGNIVGALSDKFGRSVFIPQAPRDLVGFATITITSSTSPATLIAAAGSGVFADIIDARIVNTSATATEVQFSDGTNTYEYYAPAGDMRGISLQVPDAATTANTAWTATTITSVASVKITVKYIKNK